MTKVLLVSGTGDYGALLFETASEMSVKEAYDKAVSNGGMFTEDVVEGVDGITLIEDMVTFKAFEFGEVCDDFVTFVRKNIQDYDDSKSKNFYIVE